MENESEESRCFPSFASISDDSARRSRIWLFMLRLLTGDHELCDFFGTVDSYSYARPAKHLSFAAVLIDSTDHPKENRLDQATG